MVEDFRVRVGAVIDDIYETFAATSSEEEFGRVHQRLMGNVMLLAAIMHKQDFGGEESDFLALARQALLCAPNRNGVCRRE
jgi:hypothetical protein